MKGMTGTPAKSASSVKNAKTLKFDDFSHPCACNDLQKVLNQRNIPDSTLEYQPLPGESISLL